jgi:hypothetical protein
MNRAEILGTYPADGIPFDADDFYATIVAETGVSRGFVDVVLESEMVYLMSHGHVTGDPEQQLGRDEPDEQQIYWPNLVMAVVIVAMTALILARDSFDAYTQGAFTMFAFVGAAYCLSGFARSVWLTFRDRRAARREVA